MSRLLSRDPRQRGAAHTKQVLVKIRCSCLKRWLFEVGCCLPSPALMLFGDLDFILGSFHVQSKQTRLRYGCFLPHMPANRQRERLGSTRRLFRSCTLCVALPAYLQYQLFTVTHTCQDKGGRQCPQEYFTLPCGTFVNYLSFSFNKLIFHCKLDVYTFINLAFNYWFLHCSSRHFVLISMCLQVTHLSASALLSQCCKCLHSVSLTTG